MFAAAAAGAALLTPRGWEGLLFPLRLLRLESLRSIQEWAPTDFGRQYDVEAVIVGLVLLLGTGRVKVPVFRLLLLAGLLHLAILHARHAMLGVVGTLLVAGPVGGGFAGPVRMAVCGTRRAWFGWPAAALVAALRVLTPLPDDGSRVAPVAAVTQVPATVAGTPVLNSSSVGGYLELVGMHPFIDGRVELFGDRFMDEYLEMSQGGPALARGLERYGVGWALLAVGDPLVAGFEGLAGWRRQYADPVAVVFVRG